MKNYNKIQFKQYFATTFRHLAKKKMMVLVYRSTFPVYLTMFAPNFDFFLQKITIKHESVMIRQSNVLG